jgi:hypothetical protein
MGVMEFLAASALKERVRDRRRSRGPSGGGEEREESGVLIAG